MEDLNYDFKSSVKLMDDVLKKRFSVEVVKNKSWGRFMNKKVTR